MPIDILVGMQWGDEGKGKLVDMFSQMSDADGRPHYRAVARYQGGHNAGHTVVAEGKKYVLHMVPSGIFRQGIYNVIGNGTVVDPFALAAEIEQLKKSGIPIMPENLGLSFGAHIIMPYHVVEDQGSELTRKIIDTTSRGIGPAYTSKAKREGIRVYDLCNLDRPEVRDRVLLVIERHHRIDVDEITAAVERDYIIEAGKLITLRNLIRELNESFVFDPKQTLAELEATFEPLKPYAADTSHILNDLLQRGYNVLAEGAQGTGLDVDHGTYPCVTSSSATAGGAMTGLGISPRHVERIIGVMKAYATRVGRGAFPTEQDNSIGDGIRERGGERGASTGRPRRCGWFDAVQVRDAVRKNKPNFIALMKLDVLDIEPEIPLCIEYKVDGERPAEFPADDALLQRCEAQYETHEGWMQPISHIRNRTGLPDNAWRYVGRLGDLANTPISIISVGPDRTQTVTEQRF